MKDEPVSSKLRFLVDAERARPDAPADAKATAQAKLATLLGASAGLGDPDPSGGAPPAAPAGGAAGGASGLGAAKLVGALLVGGIFGGAIAVGVMRPAERIVYVDRTPAAVSVVDTAHVAPAADAVASVDIASLPRVSAAPSARVAPPSSVLDASLAPRAHDGDLSAERSILERARSALARGDASSALAAAGQHEREFPKEIGRAHV